MAIRAVTVLLILCVATSVEARPAQQIHLRRVQEASPPKGTSLSASESDALLGLLVNDTTDLTTLYRTSVHGTTYGDMLDNVGDAMPLVFVIRKDKYLYVFDVRTSSARTSIAVWILVLVAAFLPDDPTDWHWYDCDLWHFSLAGHFGKPTKVDIIRAEQNVRVAGREGSVWGANVVIGGRLYLGKDEGSDRPAADIRSCHQYTLGHYLPEGYTGEGEGDSNGDPAYLGGSDFFHADEMEVLHVQRVSAPKGTSLSASEYEGLLGLLGNDTTELTTLFRTSVHGTEWGDLWDSVQGTNYDDLDSVGWGGLVFVIRKDKYVFGVYRSDGVDRDL
ncbi:unnamed protein product [Vitrella brassicaformis CCMP3155]|uniref:TLDc domain-containing protein n=1 Tax=Vitrella brassicaformis (strain CCMP3155) TaxID=1169540 RepID=A0A0G4GU00_VITBC|nr:unnamed protein product [Vitrella brassicaformis CCMP3155]|eukprot:CEM34099.1 unnamed protein product [Vitrella brassicaformis CCMP3155]